MEIRRFIIKNPAQKREELISDVTALADKKFPTGNIVEVVLEFKLGTTEVIEETIREVK